MVPYNREATMVIHSKPHRFPVARLMAIGLMMSFSSAVSAQQAGLASGSAGQPVPAQVAVEYATIGAVALPFRILALDGSPAGGGGQTASNLQVGNQNRTDIQQSGGANAAAIQIFGDDNTAAIRQRGTGNVGQGTLTGTGIQLDLQQTGIGNQSDWRVNAPAGANLQVQQNGNGNTASGSIPGTANVSVIQAGNGLSTDVTQVGVAKSITVLQVGTR